LCVFKVAVVEKTRKPVQLSSVRAAATGKWKKRSTMTRKTVSTREASMGERPRDGSCWFGAGGLDYDRKKKTKGEERHEVFPRGRRTVPVTKVLPF
jgi:hypothetical protein